MSELKNKFSRAYHTVGFKLKKHSPEILLAAGIITGVAGAVTACKATLKVNKVLEETKENVEKIHEASKNGVTQAGESYSQEDAKKDLTISYVQTGVKLAKLYGPSIILGGLSVTCILSSHNMMKQRNVALAAAYAAVDNGFKKYRGNVIERFGERVDKELKYGLKAVEIEETVVDENGEEKTITKQVDIIDEYADLSPYAKFFDELSMEWTKDPEYNLMFLKTQQAHANDRLKARKRVFLNEIYEMLGLPITKEGQVVGWMYDPSDPCRSNYIDFGIYKGYRSKNRDFVNGYERSILLDFNVDGDILKDM